MSSRGREAVDPKGGQRYEAAAMSLVFHTRHPMVPTLRADVRLFKARPHTTPHSRSGSSSLSVSLACQVEDDCWFGGGCDLTPSYLFDEDARSFHGYWRSLCERHHESLYPEFKKWCDEYFWIPTRKEHRGIGGIFFDDLPSSETRFSAEGFVREVGDGILPSWLPIVERRQGETRWMGTCT